MDTSLACVSCVCMHFNVIGVIQKTGHFLVTSSSIKEIVIYAKDKEIIIHFELFDTHITVFEKLDGVNSDSDYMLFLPLDLMPM